MKMKKFSINTKLNKILNYIYEDLMIMSPSEVKRYKQEFKNEIDYNIAQYGNLLIYYYEVREMYQKAGYKSIDRMSDDKLWQTYKRQVGYIARKYF